MAELNLSLKKSLPEDQVKSLLEQADWGQGRAVAHVTQQVDASDLVFSVWDGTKVVAFARVISDYSYVVVVLDFIVDKRYQGQGVGPRLMKAILGHSDLLGIKKWVVFSPVNQDFFEQFGFQRSDETMIRYG